MELDKPLSLNFADAVDESSHNESVDSDEHNEEFAQLRLELQAKNRQLDAKNQEINELKIKSRQLEQINNDIQARQTLLEEELGKAEAQIELIQELLLEDEAKETQKGNEIE